MSKLSSHFVLNFASYISAKHYLNWFTVGKVITKIKKVNLRGSNIYIKFGTVMLRNCNKCTNTRKCAYLNTQNICDS